MIKKSIAILTILLVSSISFGQDLSGKTTQELEKLKTEAVKNENYKLAGQINDEIKKRESEISNVERIAKAKIELKEAVSNENYELASNLKKEIELREKLEVEVKNENYAEAANIKRQLSGETVSKISNSANNSISNQENGNSQVASKNEVYDPNFDEANYNATVNVKGHTPPKPGKAAVYLLRVSALGFAVDFKYFNGNEFIGKSKGVSYIRTEVDPGEHVFWASGENQSFITVSAEAGKAYLVYVDVKMGMMSAQVNLSAVLPDQESRIKRGVEVINGHDPSTVSDAEKAKIVAKLKKRGYVEDKMNAYNTKWKSEKNFDHIPANSFIPESKLK